MSEPLTDDELSVLISVSAILKTFGNGETKLANQLAAIIARREPVKWLTTTHGALAEFRGWTMTVRPRDSGGGFWWSMTKVGRDGFGDADADSVEDGMQAAEKYARENPL